MEEKEILDIASQPTGMLDVTSGQSITADAMKATELLSQVQRSISKPPEIVPAQKKATDTLNELMTPQYPSLDKVLGVKTKPPQTPEEAAKLKEELMIQDAVNTIKKTGGNVAKQSRQLDTTQELIPYKEVEKYVKSGMFDEVGYQRGIDNDAAYDAKQTWYGDIGRNILNFNSKAAASFAGGMISTVDMIYQLGKYALGTNDVLDENGNRDFDRVIENTYDNAVTRAIDNFTDSVDASTMNFRNQRERELEANNPVLNLIPFYGNGFGDAMRSMGYTAGAIGSIALQEFLTAGAATPAVIARGIGYIPKLAGKVAGAVKNVERIDKMIDGMKSLGILNKLDAAIDIGAAAKKLYTGYDIGLGLKLGVRPIARQTIGAMSEASMEALETKENLLNELVEQYKTQHGGAEPEGKELQRITDTVRDAANARYIGNLALIGISNSITFNNMFKNMPLTRKLIGDEVEAGSRIVIDKATGEFVEQTAKKGVSKWAEDPRWYKQLLGKGYDKVRPYVKGVIAASEGVEEGGQMVVQKATDAYYKHQYNVNDDKFKLDEAFEAIATAMKDTLTTNEGWNAILQGVLGGTMSSVIGNAIQHRRESSPKYQQQLERIRNSNISQSASMTDRFREIMDTNSIGGSVSSKVFDLKTKQGIVDELHAAATDGDQYRYNNHKHSLQFNFVDSFLKNHQGEQLLEHLADLKELATKDPTKFNDTYGRNEEGITAGNPVDAVQELIEVAQRNIKAKEKLDLIMVNPYTNPTTLEDEIGYNRFEAYKTELRHTMSQIENYKTRVGTLEGEMQGHGSVLNQLLDNETYPQELASIKSEIDTLRGIGDNREADRLQKQYDFIEKMKDGKATAKEIRDYAADKTNVGFRDEVDGLIQKQMDIIALKQATKRAYEVYNKMIDGNGFKKFLKDDADYQAQITEMKKREKEALDYIEKVRKDKERADKTKLLKDKIKDALKKHNVDPVEFDKRNAIESQLQFLDSNYDIIGTDLEIQQWVDNQVTLNAEQDAATQQKKAEVKTTVDAVVDAVKKDPDIDSKLEAFLSGNSNAAPATDIPIPPVEAPADVPITKATTTEPTVETDMTEYVTDVTMPDIETVNLLDIGDTFADNTTPNPLVAPIPTETVDREQLLNQEAPAFEQDIQDAVEARINEETIDTLSPQRIQEVIEEVKQEVLNPTTNIDPQVHADWRGKVILSPYGSGKTTLANQSEEIFIDGDVFVKDVIHDMIAYESDEVIADAEALLQNSNIKPKDILTQLGISLDSLKDAIEEAIAEEVEQNRSILFPSVYYLKDDLIQRLNEFGNLVIISVDADRRRQLSTDIAGRDENNDISDAQLIEKIERLDAMDSNKRVDLIKTDAKTYYMADVVKMSIPAIQEKFERMAEEEKLAEETAKLEEVPLSTTKNPLRSLLYDVNTFAMNLPTGQRGDRFRIQLAGISQPMQQRIIEERLKFIEAVASGDLSGFSIVYGEGREATDGAQVTNHPHLYRRFTSGYITIQSNERFEGNNPVVFFLPLKNNLFVDYKGFARSMSTTPLFGKPLSETEFNMIKEAAQMDYPTYKRINAKYMAFMSKVEEIRSNLSKTSNQESLKAFAELANFQLQLTDGAATSTARVPLSQVRVSNAIDPNRNTPQSIAIVNYKDGQFSIHPTSNMTQEEEDSLIERITPQASKWDFSTSWWTVNFDTVSGTPIFSRVSGINETQAVIDTVQETKVLPNIDQRYTLLFNTGQSDFTRNYRLKLHQKTMNGVPTSVIRINFSLQAEEDATKSALSIDIPVDLPANPTVNNFGSTLFSSMLAVLNNDLQRFPYTNRAGEKGLVSARDFFEDTLSPLIAEGDLQGQVDVLFTDFAKALNNTFSIVKPNIGSEFIPNSEVQTGTPNMFNKVYLSTSPIIEIGPEIPVDVIAPVNEPNVPQPVTVPQEPTDAPDLNEEQPEETAPEEVLDTELEKLVNASGFDNIKTLKLSGKEYQQLEGILKQTGMSLADAAALFDSVATTTLDRNGRKTSMKINKNDLFKLGDYTNFVKVLTSKIILNTKIKQLDQKMALYEESSPIEAHTRLNESVEEELQQLKRNCF